MSNIVIKIFLFFFLECGLRFVRNDYLVIHMRRHMGVKPYKCRFCEKGELSSFCSGFN